MEGCGALGGGRYLLHDRDTKYTASFLAIIKSGQVGDPAIARAQPEFERLFPTVGNQRRRSVCQSSFSLVNVPYGEQ